MRTLLFTAQWCAPCKKVKGFVEQQGIDVECVDIESYDGVVLVEALNVKSVPTLAIIEAERGDLISAEKYVGTAQIMSYFGKSEHNNSYTQAL